MKVGKLTLTNSNAIIRDLPYLVIIRTHAETGEVPVYPPKVVSSDLSYLFYTRDLQPSMPGNPEPPIPPVAVEDDEYQGRLEIYPNPSRGFLSVRERDDEGTIPYELWDSSGRLRKRGFIVPGTTVAIDSLPAGLYMIITTGKTGRVATRLIKE